MRIPLGPSFGRIHVAAAVADQMRPSWSVAPGTTVGGLNPEDLVLSVTVTQVPERSTWAMMPAGFAGLGFLTYRASRKTKAAAA